MRKKSDIELEADAAYRRLTGPSPRVLVLPFGFCVHLFAPCRRHDTFLVRCVETGLFTGFDWTLFGWRIVCGRINHIPRQQVIQMVEEWEAENGDV